MIVIYHNRRCKKSREGLEFLEKSGKEYRIREYIKQPLTIEEIKRLLDKLNLNPLQLVRQNEKFWKENYKGKDLNDNEIIQILAERPGLIERPIIESEESAVIARPLSQIEKLI